jgi:hypothetical protein
MQRAGASEEDAARRRALCRAEITGRSGLVSRALLLGFEDGAYEIRGPEGEVVRVPESEVRRVKLRPLPEGFGRAPGPAPRGPMPDSGAEASEGPPFRPGVRGAAKRRGEFRERLAEFRNLQARLERLKRNGELDEHMARLVARLREARSPGEAGRYLWELGVAHQEKTGRAPGALEWSRMVREIRDPDVRSEVRDLSRGILRRLQALTRARRRMPPGGGPGPLGPDRAP